MKQPFTGRHLWLRLFATYRDLPDGSGFVEFRRPASPWLWRLTSKAVQQSLKARR